MGAQQLAELRDSRGAADDSAPIMQALLDEGISTRRGVMNAHREAAYPAGTWRVGAWSAASSGAKRRRTRPSCCRSFTICRNAIRTE